MMAILQNDKRIEQLETSAGLTESNEFFIDGNDLDWTQMIFTFWFYSLIAVKIPAANPPPPIGT